MGGLSTFEFVPSDYKVKYIDSLMPGNKALHSNPDKNLKTKTLKVLIAKGVIEEFKID